MDPPPVPSANASFEVPPGSQTSDHSRTQSFSAKSDDSQTASEFIENQLRLEADAREALPYRFDECTRPLGKLRQVLFSCLTCNPPPAEPSESYTPAGVCYSCSIQCHGEHILVELFNKRDFVCDCGTTRLPKSSPCTLRLNPETNTKGDVHSDLPSTNNKYNQNFKNRFCGCECDYEADKQKGTMFQCLGLGTAETGGCGEDWWHPGCVVGLTADWNEAASRKETPSKIKNEGLLDSIAEVAEAAVEKYSGETRLAVDGTAAPADSVGPEVAEDDDTPLPPGFPEEDDFDSFLCYKCVDAHPWIKRYAGAPGFLHAVFKRSAAPSPEKDLLGHVIGGVAAPATNDKKRKAGDDETIETSASTKRVRENVSESVPATSAFPAEATAPSEDTCKYQSLPPPPSGLISLFFKSDFRDHLCHCSTCFPNLQPHPQLLEEEDTYEPPLSEGSGGEGAGGSTVGSGSIYDRGESALKNVDRVRAIEGVMAYNHLKDKLKPFFQQFAESGKAISAEDIKAHFAKMRGDEQAIKDAAEKPNVDNRKEQSGY